VKRYADLTGNRKKHGIKSLCDNKSDIPGLKDPGGALAFTANLTTGFKTAWETLVSAAETAASAGKATWFEIMVPNFGSFYFAGIPSSLGMTAMDVNSVLEIEAYVTPNQIEGWASSSTT
jgi:hypothetical protein